MDNSENALNNEPVGEADVVTAPEERKGLGLGWRIGVGIVALVVLGVVAYPLFVREQFGTQNNVEVSVPPEAQSVLAEPLATAQANPDSAEAQFELGNAYYQTQQWNLAVETYQNVIETDPDFQAAYANLGATYYQLLQFNLAASQYEKALELDPQDGESAYNLGAIYLQQALSQGQQPDADLLAQAVEQIENALEISPDLAEPHFTLGVAYMALNQKEAAIQAFETYLSLDTDTTSQARQNAQGYLNTLRGQ